MSGAAQGLSRHSTQSFSHDQVESDRRGSVDLSKDSNLNGIKEGSTQKTTRRVEGENAHKVGMMRKAFNKTNDIMLKKTGMHFMGMTDKAQRQSNMSRSKQVLKNFFKDLSGKNGREKQMVARNALFTALGKCLAGAAAGATVGAIGGAILGGAGAPVCAILGAIGGFLGTAAKIHQGDVHSAGTKDTLAFHNTPESERGSLPTEVQQSASQIANGARSEVNLANSDRSADFNAQSIASIINQTAATNTDGKATTYNLKDNASFDNHMLADTLAHITKEDGSMSLKHGDTLNLQHTGMKNSEDLVAQLKSTLQEAGSKFNSVSISENKHTLHIPGHRSYSLSLSNNGENAMTINLNMHKSFDPAPQGEPVNMLRA